MTRMIPLVLAIALVTGCEDDKSTDDFGDTDRGDTEVGDTEVGDTEVVDTEVVDTDTVDAVARGDYLVNHVAGCGDCHTPRNEDGSPDTTMFLAGAFFADVDPDTDAGAIYAPNLTPHASGLGDWSAAEIEAAFTEGHDDEGEPLWPLMPYWLFGHLTQDDADAIVAYLSSIPPVDNSVPEKDTPFPVAVPLLGDGVIPHTTLEATDPHFDDAERGRYLVTVAGCIDCHSPDDLPTYPIDTTMVLAGGRIFERADLGLPPIFPDEIYTRNLTPDDHGLADWTAEDVQTALQDGTDENGVDLCPPMPAGPMGAYGGLTDDDALAIGWYLTTIPAIATDDYPECPVPG